MKSISLCTSSLWLFALFLFFIACNPEKTSVSYFDTGKYFSSQVALLDSLKPDVEKIVVTDNKIENHHLKNIHWNEELSLFLGCDLYKPVWKGKFRVDTIPGDDNYSVIYSALDSTIQLQFVMVDFNIENKVTLVRMKTTDSNKLYTMTQSLCYIPDQSYSIESEQDVFLTGKKNQSIFGTFIKKGTLPEKEDSNLKK